MNDRKVPLDLPHPDEWTSKRWGPDEDGDYWQRGPDGNWWTGKLSQNVYVRPTPLEVTALLVPLLEERATT